MRRRCPECSGALTYNRDVKMYVCTSCGRMYTREELEALLDRIQEERAGRAPRGRRA